MQKCYECKNGYEVKDCENCKALNELYITIEIKNVYGNTTMYPVCNKAKLFAEYKGQKTLTNSDIRIIKELGYKVLVQPTIKEL